MSSAPYCLPKRRSSKHSNITSRESPAFWFSQCRSCACEDNNNKYQSFALETQINSTPPDRHGLLRRRQTQTNAFLGGREAYDGITFPYYLLPNDTSRAHRPTVVVVVRWQATHNSGRVGCERRVKRPPAAETWNEWVSWGEMLCFGEWHFKTALVVLLGAICLENLVLTLLKVIVDVIWGCQACSWKLSLFSLGACYS